MSERKSAMNSHTELSNPLLYEALASYFNLEELKSRCYDLSIEHENQPSGQTWLGQVGDNSIGPPNHW